MKESKEKVVFGFDENNNPIYLTPTSEIKCNPNSCFNKDIQDKIIFSPNSDEKKVFIINPLHTVYMNDTLPHPCLLVLNLQRSGKNRTINEMQRKMFYSYGLIPVIKSELSKEEEEDRKSRIKKDKDIHGIKMFSHTGSFDIAEVQCSQCKEIIHVGTIESHKCKK